jgi:hypothetical protein
MKVLQKDGKMISLCGKQRLRCKPLFSNVPIWRAFIESAFEDGHGQIIADDESNPKAAVLFYGGLLVYAGNYGADSAEDLIRYFDIQPCILGYSSEWNERIENILGDKLVAAKRYHLPYSSLRSGFVERILEDHKTNCEEISLMDCPKLQDALGWEHQLHHYKTENDFLTNGNGFIIKSNGSIISGASSFAVSSKHSECQVTTTEAERRKGYAQIVAAAYLNRCLRKNLNTPWDAANEASVRLGQSLGFTDVTEYNIYGTL